MLILDGEELVGAKQNRLVNATLLIAAQVELVIPVSCVERGRWHHTSAAFSSSEVFSYSRLRSQKAAGVTANLRMYEVFASDQRAVWEEIDRKQAAMGSHSATAAMHDMFVDYEAEMEKYTAGVETLPGQVGVMVFVNGSFNCLDILGHSDALSRLWSKLIKSYAMEALEVGVTNQATRLPSLNRCGSNSARPGRCFTNHRVWALISGFRRTAISGQVLLIVSRCCISALSRL